MEIKEIRKETDGSLIIKLDGDYLYLKNKFTPIGLKVALCGQIEREGRDFFNILLEAVNAVERKLNEDLDLRK